MTHEYTSCPMRHSFDLLFADIPVLSKRLIYSISLLHQHEVGVLYKSSAITTALEKHQKPLLWKLFWVTALLHIV